MYPRWRDDPLGGFLHRLARQLPQHGFSIHVLTPLAAGAPGEETWDGVSIRRFPHPGRDIAYTGEMHRAALRHPFQLVGFLGAFRKAFQRMSLETKPAIVHAHWWFPSGWIVARSKLPDLDPPLVLSVHGTDIRLLSRLPAALPVARAVFKRAEAVLPVSEFLSSELGRLGIGNARRTVLPMPADSDQFSIKPSAGTRRDFVVAARLVRQKRVDVAIRGLAHARTQGVHASLHVLGDGPERGRLEVLTKDLGCHDSVHFHGFQSPDRLADWFRSALAVVLCSQDEGYGLVLVEAALCGTPGIGVKSGAIPENILDGRSGWLADAGDWKGIGNAMRSAVLEPSIAVARGMLARERALGATAQPLAEKLAGIYRQLSGISKGFERR